MNSRNRRQDRSSDRSRGYNDNYNSNNSRYRNEGYESHGGNYRRSDNEDYGGRSRSSRYRGEDSRGGGMSTSEAGRLGGEATNRGSNADFDNEYDDNYDDDDYENARSFRNDYEEDNEDNYDYEDIKENRNNSGFGRMNREDVRELGRQGNRASYGGSSYRNSNQRGFLNEYPDNEYDPYNSRPSRLTDSYASGTDNNYPDFNSQRNETTGNDYFDSSEGRSRKDNGYSGARRARDRYNR